MQIWGYNSKFNMLHILNYIIYYYKILIINKLDAESARNDLAWLLHRLTLAGWPLTNSSNFP